MPALAVFCTCTKIQAWFLTNFCSMPCERASEKSVETLVMDATQQRWSQHHLPTPVQTRITANSATHEPTQHNFPSIASIWAAVLRGRQSLQTFGLQFCRSAHRRSSVNQFGARTFSQNAQRARIWRAQLFAAVPPATCAVAATLRTTPNADRHASGNRPAPGTSLALPGGPGGGGGEPAGAPGAAARTVAGPHWTNCR